MGLEIQKHKCDLCDSGVFKFEWHFLVHCSQYSELRKTLFRMAEHGTMILTTLLRMWKLAILIPDSILYYRTFASVDYGYL